MKRIILLLTCIICGCGLTPIEKVAFDGGVKAAKANLPRSVHPYKTDNANKVWNDGYSSVKND